MLFRVEAATTTDVTIPSQTSVVCYWNVPHKEKADDVKPK